MAAQPTQKPKTSKGGPILLIGILLIILAAGGYAAYRMISGKSITMNSPLNKVQEALTTKLAQTVTEEMLKDVKDPLVRKHLVKQYSQTSYQVTSVSSGRGSGEASITAFSYNGDAMNMRTREQRDGKDILDTITIGNTYYVKDFTDNKWWMQELSDKTESVPAQLKDTLKEAVPDIKELAEETGFSMEYTSLGEEACGNLTCHKYEEKDTKNPEAKRVFWFDKKDLLLRKEIYSFGEFDSTNTYEYGVKVTAPSPTKPVPAGKSIFEYYNTQAANDYTGEDLNMKDYFGGAKESYDTGTSNPNSGSAPANVQDAIDEFLSKDYPEDEY